MVYPKYKVTLESINCVNPLTFNSFGLNLSLVKVFQSKDDKCMGTGSFHPIPVSKDHTEKIDFQEIFIAVVHWPISEFKGHLSV